jgi:integrase
MAVKVKKWKGAWWLFIDYKGKRKAKRIGVGKPAAKAAELAAIKIQARLAEGDTTVLGPTPAAVSTFAEYAERWLQGVAALRCQPSTLEQHRLRLKVRLLPHLGSLPLTAISRERIKALVAAEYRAGSHRSPGQPITPGTVGTFMGTLTAILNSAVEDEIIPANPAARWGRVVRHDQAEVEEVEVFTPEELTRLLTVAEERYPDYYPFVLCLARTGMRIGEVLALQWADLDFTNRIILVRRSTRRGETKVTKNNKARRVDMSQQLSNVLQGWRSLQEAEAAVAGTEMNPWVFPAVRGGVAAADAFRRLVWTKILRGSKLRYRKPHTLRHTFASLLIQAGEPLTYVQRQLGHHSPAFTLAVYGHFIPRGNHRAVDRLDDATGRNLYATIPEEHQTVRQ